MVPDIVDGGPQTVNNSKQKNREDTVWAGSDSGTVEVFYAQCTYIHFFLASLHADTPTIYPS